MTPEADRHHKKLRDPLPKNKAPTFSSLYEIQKKESEKSAAIKADRNILQRIITAYDAGRSVDLPRILSHDLMAVPLAITDTNGQLRTGNKSVMIQSSCRVGPNVLGSHHAVAGRLTLVVDGQALVKGLGRPSECNTFDDLADKFVYTQMQSSLSSHPKTCTDVFLLLVSHFDKMSCKQLWMKAETKKTSWKTFTDRHMLLINLGNGDLDDSTLSSVEKFISGIYKVTDAESCNEARTTLFSKCRSPEALPPTGETGACYTTHPSIPRDHGLDKTE
ncbi:hypothetical protein ACROYT_G013549 [Oculina patagonica]